MNRNSTRSGTYLSVVAVLLTAFAATACSSAATYSGNAPRGPLPPRPHTDADVHFMSGMIPHHAQAVVMSNLAQERSQNDRVKLLAERIVVSQRGEIELMQQWLADRNLPVPAADATHLTMQHDGMTHHMLMPGMLTDEELAQLRAASGVEFDRMLLRYMIRHHEGAISMVDELLDTDGAAQDDTIYKFASDVYADQMMEIERMSDMLAALGGG